MEFAENSFDAVIDKGTFDSVIVRLDLFSVERGLIQMPIRCWLKYIGC